MEQTNRGDGCKAAQNENSKKPRKASAMGTVREPLGNYAFVVHERRLEKSRSKAMHFPLYVFEGTSFVPERLKMGKHQKTNSHQKEGGPHWIQRCCCTTHAFFCDESENPMAGTSRARFFPFFASSVLFIGLSFLAVIPFFSQP